MDRNECKLQMNELYFSKYDFVQTRADNDTDYKTSFQIEYAVNSHNSSKFRIIIKTTLKNKTESVILNLETTGVFTIDKEGLNDDIEEHLIKVNTVAIMFPFIRSQISLLTTQPGFEPILLPPININALMGTDTTPDE